MPAKISRIATALPVAALLALGACAGEAYNHDMASIVAGPNVPKGTTGPYGAPLCREVGGYEAYYKRTGKACYLGPDRFNDVNYQGGPNSPL